MNKTDLFPQQSINKIFKVDSLKQWLPISLILCVAAILFFYQLGQESLWLDELYSVHDAKKIPASFSRVRPIYFIFLRLWMLFGDSDAWLRSLSVLFGLGSVWLIYELGRRVADQKTGLITAIALTLSPLFINHTQEVRMYALGTCLAILGSLLVVHILEKPTNPLIFAWLGSRLMMAMTAPINTVLILPDLVLIGLKFRKQRGLWLRFGKWFLIIGILAIPSAIVISSIAFPVFSRWLSNPQYMSPVELILKVKRYSTFPFPSTSMMMSVFFQIYTVMLLGLLGAALILKQKGFKSYLILAWTFIPTTVLYLISKKLLFDRYSLFLMPYLLILLAIGFVKVWHRWRIAAMIIAIVYLIAVSNGLVRYYTVQDRQDWRGVMSMISASEKTGDMIVIDHSAASPKAPPALQHYYDGSATIHRYEQFCSNPQTLDRQAVEEKLNSLPPIQSQVWFVCDRDFDEKAFAEFFGNKFKLESYQKFANWNFYRQNDYMYVFQTSPRSQATQN
jgi:uncharacterized membrane protein